MTDAPVELLPQHTVKKRQSPLEAWMAWIAFQAAQSEARRKAKLEARPNRLARLKAAAEKRTRRRARNLANAAVEL